MIQKRQKGKYNYKRYTILFDLDIPTEKIMVEWLEKHKGKRSGYNIQIKKALQSMIDNISNLINVAEGNDEQ
jgi:hypothetical protein